MTELDNMDLAWAVRRLPANVRTLLKAHGPKIILAGGYIRSIISGEPVNDIDLFGPSKDYLEATAKELAGKAKLYETDFAYTVTGKRPAAQFIHKWTYGDARTLVDSFDFTIAQAALWWDGSSWRSLCSEHFYADLAARRLVYTKPVRLEAAGGSMLRVLKFYQRGYRIPLDSLGAVIARIALGVEGFRVEEAWLSRILTGLLHEVDPAIDPDHIAHLPSEDQANGELIADSIEAAEQTMEPDATP